MSRMDRFKGGADLDNLPSGGRIRHPGMHELVQMADFPADRFVNTRLYPGLYLYGFHSVETRKTDGTKARFTATCSGFDHATGTRKPNYGSDDCAWCAFETRWRNYFEGDKERVCPSGFRSYVFANAIIRSLQAAGDRVGAAPTPEEEETGYKDLKSDSWTPVRVIRMGTGMLKELRVVKELNLHNTPDGQIAFQPYHPKFGCDVAIRSQPNAAPNDRWKAQRMEASRLTAEEGNYLIWDLRNRLYIPSLEESQTEFNSWYTRNKIGVHFGEPVEGRTSGGSSGGRSSGSRSDRMPDPDSAGGFEDDAPPPARQPARRPAASADDFGDDAPPPARQPARRPAASADDFEDAPPPPSRRTQAPPPADDFGDDEPPPPARQQARRQAPPADDFGDDAPPPPARQQARRPAPPAEDFDDAPPPARQQARRQAPPADDFEDAPPPPARQQARRPAPPADDFEDAPPPPARQQARRQAPPADDFEDAPPPAPRQRPSAPAPQQRRAAPMDSFDDDVPF